MINLTEYIGREDELVHVEGGKVFKILDLREFGRSGGDYMLVIYDSAIGKATFGPYRDSEYAFKLKNPYRRYKTLKELVNEGCYLDGGATSLSYLVHPNGGSAPLYMFEKDVEGEVIDKPSMSDTWMESFTTTEPLEK